MQYQFHNNNNNKWMLCIKGKDISINIALLAGLPVIYNSALSMYAFVSW